MTTVSLARGLAQNVATSKSLGETLFASRESMLIL
jgi:hypothetical protein